MKNLIFLEFAKNNTLEIFCSYPFAKINTREIHFFFARENKYPQKLVPLRYMLINFDVYDLISSAVTIKIIFGAKMSYSLDSAIHCEYNDTILSNNCLVL